MAPAARDGPRGRKHAADDRLQAQKGRALQRRDRMRSLGAGVVCGGVANAVQAATGSAEGRKQPPQRASSLNPPGGRSQLNLGSAEPGEADSKPQQRARSLAPPGGQSQMDLGDGEEDECVQGIIPSQKPAQEPIVEQRSRRSVSEGPKESYADALAAQIEAKKALKAAEKVRINRNAVNNGERPASGGAVEREDSLSRLLAEHSNAAPAPKNTELEDRRRAVPGLVADEPAKSAGSPTGQAARARSNSRSGAACPWAVDDDQTDAQAGPSGRRQGRARPPRPPSGSGGGHGYGAAAVAEPSHGGLSPAAEAQSGQPRASSNTWARGNAGNMISDRPTSRVLKPPGGGSSLQIGSWA